MLAVPGVLLDSLVTTATAVSMGFYSATLEPHLRQVGRRHVTALHPGHTAKLLHKFIFPFFRDE